MASFSFPSSSEPGHQSPSQQPSQHPSPRDNNNDNNSYNHHMSVESLPWDLSNLCLSSSTDDHNARRRNSTETDASLKQSFSSYCEPMERRNEYSHQRLLQQQPARRRHSQHHAAETSLYPNQEDLLATSFAECTVDDLFSSTSINITNHNPSSSSSSFQEPVLLRRNSSDPQLLLNQFVPSSSSTMDQSPGAFYASTSNIIPTDGNSKPPKPSWVEKSTQVEQKIELQHRKGGDNDEHSVDEAGPTTTLVPTTSTVAKQPPRPEVEVSPGVYMPLRGTDETIQAIESGRGKLVFCLACSTALQCVPDCDLVICPDCRVFSPVPKFVEDQQGVMDPEAYSRAAMTAGFDNIMVVPPPEWIGGVGLGLKVSFLD